MSIEHLRAEEGTDPDAPMKLRVAGPFEALTPVRDFLKENYQIATHIRKCKNEYVLTGKVPQPLAKEVTTILYNTYR